MAVSGLLLLGFVPCLLASAFAQPDGSAANDVVVVETALELQRAINGGTAAHVHITQHLDLSGLRPGSSATSLDALFYPTRTLESLTVRLPSCMH